MKPARVVLVAASCFSIVFISALSIAKAQSGIASIYSGGRTANGEKAAASGMTAAHKTLPFGTLVRVTHQRSGRSVSSELMTADHSCAVGLSTLRQRQLVR